MAKEEEGKEKQQLTGPEPMTSRSIADPLAGIWQGSYRSGGRWLWFSYLLRYHPFW